MFGKKKDITPTITTARAIKRSWYSPGDAIPDPVNPAGGYTVPAGKLGLTFGTKDVFLVIVDTPERLSMLFELEAALIADLCQLVPIPKEDDTTKEPKPPANAPKPAPANA